MTIRISLISLLMFGAFAGMAQTLTCTFQFSGSGTFGTHPFTNAAITITTVGKTASITMTPLGNSGPPSPSNARYSLVNDSASISISGVGVFQFTPVAGPMVGTVIPSNTTVNNNPQANSISFAPAGLFVVTVGGAMFSNPFDLFNPIGPITSLGQVIGWNYNPSGGILTSGGIVNLYDASPQMTFQSTFSGIPPTPILSRIGVLSHIAAGGGWTTVITLVNTSSAAVPVTVALHNDDGSAVTLPVTTTQQGGSQTTTTSSVSATINPNATLLISTGDQIASTVVGWADVLSTGLLGGYAIFRSTPQTGSPSEGTVPLQSQYPSTMTLPYDNTAGFVMGVALANMSSDLCAPAACGMTAEA